MLQCVGEQSAIRLNSGKGRNNNSVMLHFVTMVTTVDSMCGAAGQMDNLLAR